LTRFTEPERAANIPEFVNVEADAIQKITEAFLDDHNYFRAASEFLKAGESARAAPLLRKSLEINPNNAESRLTLANILSRDGKTEAARTHLLKILELQPDHAEAHYGLADILSRDGKTEEAKTHLLKILELQPDNAEAHYGLAVLLHEEARLQDAADHCRRAIDAQPNHYDAHTRLGLILLDSGKLDEAVEPLLAALRLKPEDAFPNHICGHAFHRQYKLQEAADYYRRAIECDPEYVPALLALASIHIIHDQPDLYNVDKALDLAKSACEATGNEDPAALEILAGVYVASGQLDEAVITARKALEVARAGGDQHLVNRLQENLLLYEVARQSR
jgi:tetratricopeptide (TPR) repeat protein